MNKIIKARRYEEGQAIVLIVLTIFGMFGFGALAVDMGQVFLARRSAQAAADAAALAAAHDMIAGSKDPAAAINRAFTMTAENGFNNDQVTNWVIVNNPPVGGPYCGVCGAASAREYYQVKITVRLKPILAQLVYKGAEQTTVEAVAHAKNADSISSDDALLSLSNQNDSMDFSGDTGVRVEDGNIHSVGGMVKNGNSGDINVTNGHVYYGTSFSGHTGPFSPGPEQNGTTELGAFTPPYCPSASEANSWQAFTGYKYKQISGVDYYYYPNGLSVENMAKGVHCVEGGIGKGNYTGSNVLIVLLSGGVQQTGNDSVDFRAAPSLIDPNGNQFGGLVFYAPPSNTSVLKFGGNSGAFFAGTIYAPGAQCDLGGTSDGRAEHTAVVCNTIKFHGTPDFIISYNPAELFHLPPSVALVQ